MRTSGGEGSKNADEGGLKNCGRPLWIRVRPFFKFFEAQPCTDRS